MRVEKKTTMTVSFGEEGEFQTEVFRERDGGKDYVKVKQGDDYVWIPEVDFDEFLRALTDWSAK